MGISAVLFDFDDTLANSLPARSAALQAVFDSAGLGDLSAPSFIGGMGGRALTDALADLADRRGVTADLFDAYADSYWTKPAGSLSLFPGVSDMLARLSGRFRLGLVTNKTRSFERVGVTAGAAAELAELGLGRAFGVVIGYEDVGRAKPDPAGLIKAMDGLGASPGETLYVGDSAADLMAAAAAGCLAGHALWGAIESATLGPAPDVSFETPEEVVAYVEGSL